MIPRSLLTYHQQQEASFQLQAEETEVKIKVM